MNERIQAALAFANRQNGRCNAGCVADRLRKDIGGSDHHPLTGVPHARFERWIGDRTDVDRCRLKFSESIYGSRPYNQPWLFPFTGRIIFLADSIRLSGHTVGLDKINHFIREGLAHWRDVQQPGGNITVVMRKELGQPGRQLRWNEYGLKGWSLTGVLAYADLAASYSGYRFWTTLISIDAPDSYVAYDDAAARFVQRRSFTFSDYANEAWDEGVNCSVFHPALAKQVTIALQQRSMACPAGPLESLWTLPDANLYVNPKTAVVGVL